MAPETAHTRTQETRKKKETKNKQKRADRQQKISFEFHSKLKEKKESNECTYTTYPIYSYPIYLFPFYSTILSVRSAHSRGKKKRNRTRKKKKNCDGRGADRQMSAIG
jgi:hypothetical protein